MVIPLLPFYAKDMGGGGLWVGVLVSAFSLAQLISAPLWGRVSDRHGRRPALLIGLGAAAISYVVFAFAQNLWILLLSRLVQGAGGGTVGVLQAYIADATEPQDRAKSLGWLSAATNLGVSIGPLIGSFSLVWGRSAPGLIAALRGPGLQGAVDASKIIELAKRAKDGAEPDAVIVGTGCGSGLAISSTLRVRAEEDRPRVRGEEVAARAGRRKQRSCQT